MKTLPWANNLDLRISLRSFPNSNLSPSTNRNGSSNTASSPSRSHSNGLPGQRFLWRPPAKTTVCIYECGITRYIPKILDHKRLFYNLDLPYRNKRARATLQEDGAKGSRTRCRWDISRGMVKRWLLKLRWCRKMSGWRRIGPLYVTCFGKSRCWTIIFGWAL